MKILKRLLCAAVVLAACSAQASIPVRIKPLQDKTVVLVHGAFADGSSWAKVIPLLQAAGLKVVATQNPLTGLADDVAVVNRMIDNQTAPVILVGHSWGGMVISEAGNNAKVESLVYVAAFAPSEGQSITDLAKDYPVTPGLMNLVADAAGYLTLNKDGMQKDFAQDLSEEETNVMYATQGPTAGRCFTDAITTAAWRTKPSSYIVSDSDRMIQPELQTALAAKLNATTLHLPTSHVPMLSKPAEVAAVIISAAGL
jgi:pimeloyl-ACP methyl ester carboxylesterase